VPTVIDEILAARDCGVVHCGFSDARDLPDVAAAFGLAIDESIYREIGFEAARDLVTNLLHRDQAYDSEIMALARATDLADRFLREATSAPCRYLTNMISPRELLKGRSTQFGPQWNPATTATFDMGVLLLGARGSACFWVEDED